MFPKSYRKAPELIKVDTLVYIYGKLNLREEEPISDESKIKEQDENENPEPTEPDFHSGSEPVSTNIPPVADAGPNQKIYYLNIPPYLKIVYFNGSNSNDPDGIIVNYTWDFGDGTTDLGETTSHGYTSPGIFSRF